MSTERVSDEELERYAKAFAGRGCTFQFDHFESIFRELQQRRETDRRIAWEAQRELWIQNAYDNNPLKQAISELLP